MRQDRHPAPLVGHHLQRLPAGYWIDAHGNVFVEAQWSVMVPRERHLGPPQRLAVRVEGLARRTASWHRFWWWRAVLDALRALEQYRAPQLQQFRPTAWEHAVLRQSLAAVHVTPRQATPVLPPRDASLSPRWMHD